MADAQRTTDHGKIRQWAEQRGGKPATVTATKENAGAGLLRIEFPGYDGHETLERISWTEFFEKFDEEELEFLYQDQTAEGGASRFCRFVRNGD